MSDCQVVPPPFLPALNGNAHTVSPRMRIGSPYWSTKCDAVPVPATAVMTGGSGTPMVTVVAVDSAGSLAAWSAPEQLTVKAATAMIAAAARMKRIIPPDTLARIVVPRGSPHTGCLHGSLIHRRKRTARTLARRGPSSFRRSGAVVVGERVPDPAQRLRRRQGAVERQRRTAPTRRSSSANILLAAAWQVTCCGVSDGATTAACSGAIALRRHHRMYGKLRHAGGRARRTVWAATPAWQAG